MPSEKRPLTRPRPAGLSDILTPSDSLAYRKPVFLPSPGLDNMLKCVYTPSMQDQTRQYDLPAGNDAVLQCHVAAERAACDAVHPPGDPGSRQSDPNLGARRRPRHGSHDPVAQPKTA